MERIVHKSHDFKSAAEWDIEQHVRMSPQERMRAARALKDKVYPAKGQGRTRMPQDRVEAPHCDGMKKKPLKKAKALHAG